MKLYNANTATLYASLFLGAAGFSGVLSNFMPRLYAYLCHHYEDQPQLCYEVSTLITTCALIERQMYPANAKYFLKSRGVFSSFETRTQDASAFGRLYMDEVDQMMAQVYSFMAHHNMI